LYTVPFIIAVALVYSLVNVILAKRTNQTEVYKKSKHNFALKLCSILVLAVALFITNGVNFVITDGGNPHKFADGKIYDKDSFVALMETEDPGNGPFVIEDYADDENYEENEDEENREFITDDDNNVVCEFINRNHSVATYEYEFDSKGELVIRVFTDEDLENGNYNLNLIQAAFAVAYAAEVAGVAIFYFKKRKK
ncbi:MAG: hypothetical protein K2K01_01525, partial [Eubacterium sp.]|nr:hypothetical protein [Eubacterium sp.]